ncbi:MAG: hypothetical protein AAF493_03175 [Pseudomonadota bacterium]
MGQLKRLLLIGVGALVTVTANVATATPDYGVCRAQLESYVATRFGQTVTDVKIHYEYDERYSNWPPRSEAVVYTKECPGYHFFDVSATYFTCETQAHYGQAPNYIFYRNSAEGC